MEKREEANAARARFSADGSDLLTDLNAYDTVFQLGSEGKQSGAVRKFCEEVFHLLLFISLHLIYWVRILFLLPLFEKSQLFDTTTYHLFRI
jgi:hypothetical protein